MEWLPYARHQVCHTKNIFYILGESCLNWDHMWPMCPKQPENKEDSVKTLLAVNFRTTKSQTMKDSSLTGWCRLSMTGLRTLNGEGGIQPETFPPLPWPIRLLLLKLYTHVQQTVLIPSQPTQELIGEQAPKMVSITSSCPISRAPSPRLQLWPAWIKIKRAVGAGSPFICYTQMLGLEWSGTQGCGTSTLGARPQSADTAKSRRLGDNDY